MRAIDADALTEIIHGMYAEGDDPSTYHVDAEGDTLIGKFAVVDAIFNMPTIQPEIIRCKDCRHWIPYDWMFSELWQSKNIADYPEDDIGCDCCDMAMKANDFCSRAERREVTT